MNRAVKPVQQGYHYTENPPRRDVKHMSKEGLECLRYNLVFHFDTFRDYIGFILKFMSRNTKYYTEQRIRILLVKCLIYEEKGGKRNKSL